MGTVAYADPLPASGGGKHSNADDGRAVVRAQSRLGRLTGGARLARTLAIIFSNPRATMGPRPDVGRRAAGAHASPAKEIYYSVSRLLVIHLLIRVVGQTQKARLHARIYVLASPSLHAPLLFELF